MSGMVSLNIDRIRVTNVTLTGKTNLIQINRVIYAYLMVSVRNFNLSFSMVDDGSGFMYFQHSANLVDISNIGFENNSG